MCYACKSEKLVNNLKHVSLWLMAGETALDITHSVALLGCSLEELAGSAKAIVLFFSIFFLLTADGIYTQELGKSRGAICRCLNPHPHPQNDK